MKANEVIAGLNVLQPYYKDPGGYNIGAEHDQIYAYATDFPLTKPDVQLLCTLGWFQEDVQVADDKDFGPDDYDPEEGWSTYV
jgi:hypothetical protein